MRFRPAAVTRKHLASSVRVALIATLVVVIVYAGAVAILDLFVSHRLVSQVGRQLADRLTAAHGKPPAQALLEPNSPGSGIHYGLGIYGEPIYIWDIPPGGSQSLPSRGAPPLPSHSWPAPGSGATTRQLDGSSYLLQSFPYRGGLLVAGESLAELSHVENVLRTSELVAAPVLVVAVFLASLLIGLRTAAPIELARRRQLEFTADASHELRTPLSVIGAEVALARGVTTTDTSDTADESERSDLPGVSGKAVSSALMSNGGVPGGTEAAPAATTTAVAETSTSEALDRIARESDRLNRIVDDLLWLARFDSAPPPPGAQQIDVGTIAEVGVERFRSLAGASALDIAVVRTGPEPATIVAPAEWIDRLLGVLLDNACKYTPDGGAVRVEVGRSSGRVVLAVEDSGPGLPMEERERLFERFRRGTARGQGHGLGLAIADSVVRSTGGKWKLSQAAPPLGGARMEVSWPK